MKALLTIVLVIIQLANLAAADTATVEKLIFQFDEHGGARAIGVIKNTSPHLIAMPVLVVTFVTKQKPTVVLTQQMNLSSSVMPGESRPFHSGSFTGPPFVASDGGVATEQVAEIKSTRLHPLSLTPPSPDWTARLAGREGISVDAPILTFDSSRMIGVRGKLLAPAGARIQAAEFTAACFDSKGELVDVLSFSTRSRDGKCIESFPFPFEAALGTGDPRIARSTVKCFCDRIILCQ